MRLFFPRTGSLIGTLILSFLILPLNDIARAQQKPWTKDQIIRMLKGDVPPKRVAELARERGIDFELTPETEKELRTAGANDDLLNVFRELAPTAEDHFKRGDDALKRQDTDGAIREYREAIRLNPDYFEAHNALGGTLGTTKGDWNGAILEFREAIRLKPDSYKGHLNLGYARTQTGDWDGAISELREATRLKPDEVSAHVFLGGALEHKGSRQAALEEYRTADRLAPGNSTVRSNYERLLKELAPVPPASAATPILLIETKPGNARVYLDGEEAGNTKTDRPFYVSWLQPGTHRVRIVLDGYREYSQSVELAAGQTATVTATLEAVAPAGGEPHVDVNPVRPPPAVPQKVARFRVQHVQYWHFRRWGNGWMEVGNGLLQFRSDNGKDSLDMKLSDIAQVGPAKRLASCLTIGLKNGQHYDFVLLDYSNGGVDAVVAAIRQAMVRG